LAKLTRKLDAAWSRAKSSDTNPLQRYERRRKWTALFLWAVGILVALPTIFLLNDAFTIGTPVIVALVALAVLTLAGEKAEN
jgi:hypothetical protein